MKKLKMVIPKGKLYRKVVELLNNAGFGVEADERVYVPRVADQELEAKVMKPQNIPRLIELGAHDIGFSGLDWVKESGADVAEIMDLRYDPVRLVAAVPINVSGKSWQQRRVVVASEYENITRRFLEGQGVQFVFLRTFGATEVFPPDDADLIVDNIASGRTLREHNLKVAQVIMTSSTRFIANHQALTDPWKSEKIERMRMLFQAVIDASERVMLEMNVPAPRMAEIVGHLPCMKSPTVAPLYGNGGYAVKVAVKKEEVATLIPWLKKMGASDILEYAIAKVVP